MGSERPSGKREWSGIVTVLITVGTTLTAIVLRFGALEEAKENAIKALTNHERRIADMERNNALLERIHLLEIANVEMKAELRGLRDEIARIRIKR
jgi:hypothetical protein